MVFLFYILTIFLSSNTITAYENDLWQQIIPLIKKTEGNRTPNKQDIIKDCIAQAILLDGDSPQRLDHETLQTLQSLHIFSEILPKIMNNNLLWGYFELARKICQITDDPQVLKKRNILALYLQDNPKIIEEINDALKMVKEAESDFLILFYFRYLKKETINPSNPLEEGFYYLEELEKKALSNRYTGGMLQLSKQCIGLLSVWTSLNTLYNFQSFHEHNIANVAYSWTPVLGANNANSFASFWLISTPWTTLVTLGTLIGIVMTTKSLKADFDHAHQKQKSLMLFRQVIKASQEVVKIIENNSILEEFLPEYRTIKKFAEYQKHPELLSEKMNHFLNLLDSYPFNQEPSAFPFWQGKIFETFILYEELKHEIVPLWQAMGNLDAQIGIQNILTTHPNFFCIPQWIESQAPTLEIEDYWHPMISEQMVVKNSIALGSNNIARNTIITGANAGGKTTAMTAMMICAIFAQSIGIVPAQSYKATPFTRMHTYLDITTNLAANESLFIAQANRAKHLYESIKSCNSEQKTITILDEILTGTRADFAQEASYEFAQKLGALPNSISIIATHFPKLTELEQTNSFINYQAAPATIDLYGDLQYPYLIIPGISDQNIADLILKQRGILN